MLDKGIPMTDTEQQIPTETQVEPKFSFTSRLKSLKSKRFLSIILVLVGIPVTVALLYAPLRYFTSADESSPEMYFNTVDTRMVENGTQNLKLFIDPNGKKIGYVAAKVEFNKTYINLASEPVINTGKFDKLIQKSTLDEANSSGSYYFAVAVSPSETDNLVQGTSGVEVIDLPFKAISATGDVTSYIDVKSEQLEVWDDVPTNFASSITNLPRLTVLLNPQTAASCVVNAYRRDDRNAPGIYYLNDNKIIRDGETIVPGERITYELKTNAGSSSLTGVVMEGTTSAKLRYMDGDNGCSGSASSSFVSCRLGEIAVSDYNKRAFRGDVINTATAGAMIARFQMKADNGKLAACSSTLTVRVPENQAGNNSGNSNNNNNNGNNANNNSDRCENQEPNGAPDLYQINVTNNKADVFFAPAGKPYTEYAVEFGENGVMQHAALYSSNDAKGALTTSVNYLKPNTAYTFHVRVFNGCKPGSWSNKVTIKTTGGAKKSYYRNSSIAVSSTVKNTISKIVNGGKATVQKTTVLKQSGTVSVPQTKGATSVETAKPTSAAVKQSPLLAPTKNATTEKKEVSVSLIQRIINFITGKK
jgi:hypothetical protein